MFSVVFEEFLGIPFELIVNESTDDVVIELSNGRKLHVDANWWGLIDGDLFNEAALPNVRNITCDFSAENEIPLLFGSDDIIVNDTCIYCGVDIFSTCFFMLTRIEEAIIEDIDNHERFPGVASVAYKNNFLDRPITDEYVEILWNMLSWLDNTLQRKSRKFSNFITCDVDWPFDPIGRSFFRTLATSISDIVRRRAVLSAIKRWLTYSRFSLGLAYRDEYRETINWIMKENEEAGNKVAFYFITRYTSPFDSSFDFDSKEMRVLIREIFQRGHEIGLHPGYNCFNHSSNFTESSNILKRVLAEEGIQQSCLGGRMHFLRWDVLKTPHLWEENGFNYDSTLSFADKSGFRCGTSREFTMYDLVNRKPFKLKQRPLINMESTIIDAHYENMGYTNESIQRFKYFKQKTEEFEGAYCLLWHNTHLKKKEERQFYRELIT